MLEASAQHADRYHGFLADNECVSRAQVDCFSYGVVLWEIVTKEAQTQRGNWRPVLVPDECPAEVEELLQASLVASFKDTSASVDAGLLALADPTLLCVPSGRALHLSLH